MANKRKKLILILTVVFIILMFKAIVSSATAFFNIVNSSSGASRSSRTLEVHNNLKENYVIYKCIEDIGDTGSVIFDLCNVKAKIVFNISVGQNSELKAIVHTDAESRGGGGGSGTWYPSGIEGTWYAKSDADRVQIDVTIPARVKKISISAVKADINIINDLNGELTLNLDEGNLRTAGFSGKAIIEINEGMVDMNCRQLNGGSSISLVKGNININAEMTAGEGKTKISTGNGNVNLIMPEDQIVDLSAEGIIYTCAFPYNSSAGSPYTSDFTILGDKNNTKSNQQNISEKNKNPRIHIPQVLVFCKFGKISVSKKLIY